MITIQKLISAPYFVMMLAIIPPGTGRAMALEADDKIGGTMRAEVSGKQFHFPILKNDISADIEGDLANVTVRQTFINPTATPLNASYLFPLNKDAAIYSMEMVIGSERVVSIIKKKDEARARFEKAKSEGRAAALLNQHRPNMFTQELANLMPGAEIKIVIKYAQSVPRIDGAYELVVPLVVGPRYTPRPRPTPQIVRNDEGEVPLKSGQWKFSPPPKYPEVSGLTIPDTVEKDRVSIAVRLKAGFAIKNVSSRTHMLDVEGDARAKSAKLATGRTVDNRDFVMRYELSGKTVEAGLLTSHSDQGEFLSLLIEPPKAPDDTQISPREMVFLLDVSGSMSGVPIEASKTFMRHALKSLRPNDYFRIIRFSSNASEFSALPVKATLLNKMAGINYVNSLSAGGGTEVMSGLRRAFAVPKQDGTLRIVTFLSDGYIGNEAEIIAKVATDINGARIYAFGVGTSVNRYFLAEVARKGRGFARFIDPTEDSHEVAIELAKHLEAPVLTDIEIDWGALKLEGITPQVLPDLFKGSSLRIMARAPTRLEPGLRLNVTIKGLVNGRKAVLPVQLTVQGGADNEYDNEVSPLPIIWARSRVADHMRDLTNPLVRRRDQLINAQLTDRITNLGLQYSLMTQWTSFVAESSQIMNEDGEMALDRDVPLNQVEGVSEHAYGEKTVRPIIRKTRSIQPSKPGMRAATSRPKMVAMAQATQQHFSTQSFSGGSTPEPGVIGGLIVLMLMMSTGVFINRKRKA